MSTKRTYDTIADYINDLLVARDMQANALRNKNDASYDLWYKAEGEAWAKLQKAGVTLLPHQECLVTKKIN